MTWAELVLDVPDWPSPGVLFKDLTPVLADPRALREVVDALAADWGPVDAVVGVEARGFVVGAAVAVVLGTGFVPLRKAGKLPRETISASYALEYGTATLQVHRDAFAAGARVLVVDDVLATGGTAVAALILVQQAGADPVGLAVAGELAALSGRAAIAKASRTPVRSLLAW